MDGLTLSSCSINRSLLPSFCSSRRRIPYLYTRKPSYVVSASKDNSPELDRWDEMELKFGRLLGEDPKLTRAKIMGRKSNPDASYLEIEKSFENKKDKLVDYYKSEEGELSSSLSELNLVRPVPKKGAKFKANDKQNASDVKKASQSVGRVVVDSTKSSIPNVILRKPSTFNEDDTETEKSSRLKIKPNLLLKMRKEQPKEKFSDITLLKRPEPGRVAIKPDEDKVSSGDNVGLGSEEVTGHGSMTSGGEEIYELEKDSLSNLTAPAEAVTDTNIGLQPLEQIDLVYDGKEADIKASDANSVDSSDECSLQAELQGKPQRPDKSVDERSRPGIAEASSTGTGNNNGACEIENFISTSSLLEREDSDWKRALALLKTGGREEVELINCSTRGFVASFGSLIGFLPYRNLVAKWKFLAFESWLRKKGLDPAMYKQNLGIIGPYEIQSKTSSPELNQDPATDQKNVGELSPNMKLEDLLEIYDQEKFKFLSSFVGQRIKVNVVMADRNSRRLMFSGRPKEKEELVEKKRSLMAKLSVGDIVKCCIKKITYFGIFVEVEGVPALIHESEVSWDATLDPSSCFKIGQIVDAKVHQLDFVLERITLSLKEITPDPLIEALESVIGDHNSLDGRLEATQADAEWADAESLIKELQQMEGIQLVSRGRFFLSPGLAPTFQVYMASMFDNQFKLLARSGNKVQEVIVQASLDKEEMKAAILTCTNRVE